MPNYIESLYNASQTVVTDVFNSPEFNNTQANATRALLTGTEEGMYRESLAAMREREDHVETTYFLTRVSDTVTNTRTFNHTGGNGGSAAVSITWDTYVRSWSQTLKQMRNNVVSTEDMMRNEMRNAILDLHRAINNDSLLFLATERATAAAKPVYANATYNGLTETYEIAAADADTAYYDMNSVFVDEEYSNTGLVIVADTIRMKKDAFLQAQGPGNDTNYAYQYNIGGNQVFVDPEAIDKANYGNGVYFAYPRGTVGMLSWIPPENREGAGGPGQTGGMYATVPDPVLGITYALHMYEERADATAVNGSAQDIIYQMELSVDFSRNRSLITTAPGLSPIHRFGVLS